MFLSWFDCFLTSDHTTLVNFMEIIKFAVIVLPLLLTSASPRPSGFSSCEVLSWLILSVLVSIAQGCDQDRHEEEKEAK